MNIRETNNPCFVAACERCGFESWPPRTTKEGATRDAEKEWGFVQRDGVTLCGGCADGAEGAPEPMPVKPGFFSGSR